jgi:hypothetical protein
VNVVVGILIAAFGLAFAIFASRFSRASAASSRELFGNTGGRPMQVWNRIVFMVVGSALAVLGILYVVGAVG